MSTIYSFLQKRKMHESQHGIFMVVIAYVLSFIMLVLGSDVFYNINSAAAGVNIPTKEETTEAMDLSSAYEAETLTLYSAKPNLINPYGLGAPSLAEQVHEDVREGVALEGDTFWLLGSAIDSGYINEVMERMSLEQNGFENTSQAKATNTNQVMTLTKEEVRMLERIVESEATGEDMIGKILIANVIFNRMEDEEFPDTVEGVIFHKVNGEYQFSPVDDKRFWSVKITSETQEAVQRALQGEDYSEGALYFMSKKRARKSSVKWFDQNLDWLFKHGGHDFYKND